MELRLKKISVTLLDMQMTDQQLKEEIDFLKEYPIRSIFVLPYQVRRVKHLLSDSMIQVGSIVDYTLGAGTLAKKAFETSQIYQEGAMEVHVGMHPTQLINEGQESYRLLEQLSFGRNDLGFFIASSLISEEQKRNIAMKVAELDVKVIVLGNDLSVDGAMYDLTVFRLMRRKHIDIQVHVEKPTLLEIEMLYQAGATRISIGNYRELLPLISERD